jgi:hypothetical protein
VILVPRQLQRAGMTGNVPYYGGRFTPEQAYAAAQPHGGRLGPVTPRFGGGRASSPAQQPHATSPPADPAETLRALERLRDSGVITASEFENLRSRVR